MDIPKFKAFLDYLDKNAEEIFTLKKFEVIQTEWPISKENFSALIQKIENDAMSFSAHQTLDILRAYHQWLSEQ